MWRKREMFSLITTTFAIWLQTTSTTTTTITTSTTNWPINYRAVDNSIGGMNYNLIATNKSKSLVYSHLVVVFVCCVLYLQVKFYVCRGLWSWMKTIDHLSFSFDWLKLSLSNWTIHLAYSVCSIILHNWT